MNKIYFLFSISFVILSSSCAYQVLITEPISFSGSTTVESMPDDILGTYTISSSNHKNFFLSHTNEISISESKNILNINGTHQQQLMFDFRTNIAYSISGGPLTILHGKELKVFSRDENIYVSIPHRDGYWYFMVIEPMAGDRIKVTYSGFNEDEFKENKYFYETNENFINYVSKDSNKLIFNFTNEDKFEKILNDGKLFRSFVLTKKT